MEDKILKLLGRREYTPSNVPQLLQGLELSPGQQQELQEALRQLEQAGKVLRTKGNRYIKSEEAGLVSGIIRINRQGKGFVKPEETGAQEITIPESATSTALHGDRVLVRRDIRPQPRGGQPLRVGEETGAVVRILDRKRTQIVGTLQQSRQFLFVIPDDPRIPHDIYVPAPKDVGRPAVPGDKVVVELREWQSRHTNPEGEVIEVLGAPDEEGVDMLSVVRQYQLPLHFPQEVLEEANAIAARETAGLTQEEWADRVDCREHLVVTIDPDDAKDFDDAICLQRADHDHWRLWVHIADVSHYVRPGSRLDVEAQARGNSTYLVDRVIPMLPEALSNELCSLKPDVDRLTKCVEFDLSGDGDVRHAKFYSAVIRSKRRFSYKEAFARLQAPPVDEIDRMLHAANEMAQKIRRARFQNGSLDLDFPETKIRLDEQGKVKALEKVENDISHQLIEEYMLLANEAVATQLMKTRTPAIYRVHEEPSPRRLDEYREEVLSHQIPAGNLSNRREVQQLLERLNTLAIGQALKIGFLKSLMRARYAVEPIGHYGLSKAKYTHFTSPIRRYADLEVHRALFSKTRASLSALTKIADHISETERNSDDAERDSKQAKLFAYLKTQIASGQRESYPALIIDVRNFGFFVDVPTIGMSGLVHLSSIEDDFFVFDPVRNNLVGRRSRRVIKLGDRVTVQVDKVDTFKRQVDYRLVQTAEARDRTRAPKPPLTERGRREPVMAGSERGRAQRDGGARRPVSSGGVGPRRRGGSPRAGERGHGREAGRPRTPGGGGRGHGGSTEAPSRDERRQGPGREQRAGGQGGSGPRRSEAGNTRRRFEGARDQRESGGRQPDSRPRREPSGSGGDRTSTRGSERRPQGRGTGGQRHPGGGSGGGDARRRAGDAQRRVEGGTGPREGDRSRSSERQGQSGQKPQGQPREQKGPGRQGGGRQGEHKAPWRR
jgi:ribonuclease R